MFGDSGCWAVPDEVHSCHLRDFGRIRALVISNYSDRSNQGCSYFAGPQFVLPHRNILLDPNSVPPHPTILCSATALFCETQFCAAPPLNSVRPHRTIRANCAATLHNFVRPLRKITPHTDRLLTRTFQFRSCNSRPCSRTYFCSRVFRTKCQAYDAFDRTVYSEARCAGAFYILPVLLTQLQDLPVRSFNLPCFYAMPAVCPKLGAIPSRRVCGVLPGELIDELLARARLFLLAVQFRRSFLSR